MTEAGPVRRKQGNAALAVGGAVVVLALGAFGFLLLRAQALPRGVEPVAWDKVACANCRMHVGERGFAAQLQAADGRVLNFDDPGCLFQYEEREKGLQVHAVYFHHHREERWVPAAQVGFVPVNPTPMGFGLGAVDAQEPGALGLAQAKARVLQGKADGRPEAHP